MFSNKTKIFLLLTLVFITMLGVSAATAADIDNNATDTSSISQNTITQTPIVSDNNVNTDISNNAKIIKNTQENVKNEGEGTFTDIESELATSSEITLTKDYVCSSGESAIAIHGTKTIDGAGHTISDVTKGLFVVATDGELTIKNLNVIAGESTTADVIALNGKITCEKVTFDMAKSARASYGIINYNTDGAAATITNCDFKNFETSQGPVNLYRAGTVDMDGCTFTNISASNSPVKLWRKDSNATVKNSRFVDCINANHGGAICLNNFNQIAVIDNCYFENCQAAGSGVICAQAKNTTVSNSEFKNCKNTGTGSYAHGAICVRNGNAILYTSNNVMDDPEVQDAEIYVQSGKIHAPKITGQDVTAQAGEEISINYTLTDDNDNSVELAGNNYNIKFNGAYLTAVNSEKGLISQTATAPEEDGIYPAEISLESTAMIDGDAVITDANVQVGTVSSDIIITDDTYSNFFNDDGTIKEGTITEGTTAKFDGTFTNKVFDIAIPMTIDTGDNPAVFDGCTITSNAELTIKNVKFTGGDSASTFKAVKNITFDNVTFDGVKASSASMIDPSASVILTFNNCTINNFEGGSLVRGTGKKTGVNVNIIDSIVKDNNATFSLLCSNGNTWKINLKNSNFTNNYGQSGGIIQGMSTGATLNVNIDECNIDSTTATGKAGVIYSASNNAVITLTNNNFTNNKVIASTSGGTAINDLAGVVCIGNANNNLTLSNNIMTDNEARNGTDIYFEVTSLNKVQGIKAKLVAPEVSTDKDQNVDITVKLTDDMGNLIGFKQVFAYTATVNEEDIITNGNGIITKTINATYTPGKYPITLTVTGAEDKFESLEIVNGELEVIGTEPAILTEETWDQFFNEDGTPKTDVVESGSELAFYGTFTGKTMNINIPLTIVTGDDQAVFKDCTITINDEVTIKDIEATNTKVSVSANKKLNIINSTFTDFNANDKEFDVASGATVNVESSTFKNIGTQGAFYFSPRSNGDFKDSEFINCTSTVYGGAITAYGRGTFNVENCTFTDNSAIRGGAIYSKGTLTVKDSTFTGNKATPTEVKKNQGGCVMYVEGSLYLYNNTMTDNTGLTADIYNSYATIYTPVKITINDAEAEEGSEVNLTATITDADGNTIDLIADLTGIAGEDEDVQALTHFNLTVNGEKFDVTRNQSLKGIVTRPIVADFAVGTHEINAEYWSDEFADATVTPGTLTITEAPATSYAKLQKMVDESTEDTVIVDKEIRRGLTETIVKLNKSVTIDLNGLTWDATTGQAIEIENGATATIKNGIVVNIDNTDPSYSNSYGRFARITNGNLVLENITITNCSAPDFSSSAKGSLVRLNTGATLTVNNCTITDIKGRFAIDNGRGTIDINDTKFINNKLGSIDSLIEINGKTTINNTEFNSNTANQAIIYGNTQKDLLTIDKTIFDSNVVTVGAPVYTGANSEVYNSVFLNNKATRMTAKSGAIYTTGGSLTVTNSTFIGNTASDNDGSIIRHSGYFPGDLTVTNSVLIPADNKAAIYNIAEDNTIKAVANYNYWGTNSTPASFVKSGTYEEEDDYGWDYETVDCAPIKVDNWVVMNTTITPEDFFEGETVEVETSYRKYTDGTNFYDLEGAFPDMTISYTVSEGTIEPAVITENGVAKTEYVAGDAFTLTATDGYVTNVIDATAMSPDPVVITLNDGNWTEYFNDDGTTKRIVTPGSELRFEGEFNNRYMLISIPLNLTTAETQGVLKNSPFIVTADNVNITKLQMVGTDTEDALINIDGAANANIVANTLTLNNSGEKAVTHTIDAENAANLVIKENVITTVGPELNIVYSKNDQVELVYTTSLQAIKCNGVIIDNNTITTMSNGVSTSMGTIYGVYVAGEYVFEDENYVENAQITRNIINTESDVYAYGISLGHADTALVDANDITVTGKNYANAIQGFNVYNVNFTNNNAKVTADKLGYGIHADGFFFMDSKTGDMDTLIVEGNLIANNTIDIEAKDAWGIEYVIADDNKAEYNNVTIKASNAVGIGLADSTEATVQYNNVNIDATQTAAPNNGDALNSYTAGIKICLSNSQVKAANDNTVTFNNITVNAAKDDVGAVNVSSNTNTITDNFLISNVGVGDNAVVNTGSSNIVKDNTPAITVITLNDGNWTEYFNEDDGTPKKFIAPGSELRFEGEFNDRYMLIDMPLNLTTAETQAKFNGCTFYITADNVNLTNVEMTTTDSEEALIELDGASNVNIEDNTLTLTNTEDEVLTYSVIINGGSDNVLRNNVITTTGPEDTVDYKPDNSIKTLYTASVRANTNNLIVDKNTIITKNNDVEAQTYGTLFGLYISGDNYDNQITGIQITNNHITTEGKVYEYGIKLYWANHALIENNTITCDSEKFTSGIHPFVISDSVINNNVINSNGKEMGYGIVLEGAMDLETFEVRTSDRNNVTNNVIDVESKYVWAIESYAGNENLISYNNITVKADNGIGIGITDQGTTASYNNVEVYAAMESDISGSFDFIDPYTAGIKVTNNGLRKVSDNTVIFNNVTVNAPNSDISAVNSSVDKTTVTDNYLIAPNSFGDNSVLSTGKEAVIKDNTPSTVITDETYDQFFDENCALKPLFNNTDLTVSGDIIGKVFIFDGVNVTITNDGTSKLYESQIMTGNNATVVFNGIEIENSFDAIVFESAGNVLNNSIITINSEDSVYAITIYDDNNIIANTIVNVNAPASDVQYNSDWSTKAPAPTAILVSSSNNELDNVTVNFETDSNIGSESSTINGIHIGSVTGAIANNTVRDSKVNVKGPRFVYGINVGNAKDTTLENVEITAESEYYADAVQMFDADTITVSGSANVKAATEAYGVYSTAMGTGASKNIDLTGFDVTVEAPKATGVLVEGSSNVTIADATYTIIGDKATAIDAHIDWMGNIPSDITITNNNINIDTTGDANALYFGKANNVLVDNNHIETTGGEEININATPNAKVTNNYIVIKDVLSGSSGNRAVITTEDDTVIENNTPTSKIIEDLEDEIARLEEEIAKLKAAKETTLTLDPVTDAKYNENVTISGTLINDDYIGLFNQVVTLTINGEEINVTTKDGAFEYTTAFKTIGEQTVKAVYAGTEKYQASEDEITFNVEKQDMLLTINPIADAAYGDTITVSGTFTTPKGQVISNSVVGVYVNGKKYVVKTDADGVYSVDVKVTQVGENNVTVKHNGNDRYNGYETSVTFNAEKQDVIVTLDAIADAKVGDNVTITGKFTDANGKAMTNSVVAVYINGKKYAARTDSTGAFSLTTAVTKEGINNVTASYAGNDKYNAFESEVATFTAGSQDVIITADPISDVTLGENVTITGTFTDKNGKAISNSVVTVKINGKKYTARTDSKGVFTLSAATKTEGVNNVTLSYAGGAKYNAYETETTFTVKA